MPRRSNQLPTRSRRTVHPVLGRDPGAARARTGQHLDPVAAPRQVGGDALRHDLQAADVGWVVVRNDTDAQPGARRRSRHLVPSLPLVPAHK